MQAELQHIIYIKSTAKKKSLVSRIKFLDLPFFWICSVFFGSVPRASWVVLISFLQKFLDKFLLVGLTDSQDSNPTTRRNPLRTT